MMNLVANAPATRVLGRLAPLAALSLAACLTQTASAAVLYDNGPVNGTVDAWTINAGFSVEDSFTLSSAATVTGVTFASWAFPGDKISSVDWAILPASGFTGGTTASVTSSYQYTNDWGYDIASNTFSTGKVTLAAGTYYLELQKAVATNGDAVYWDQNNGASTANENAVGPIGSQSFQILGTSAVPEPATWAMMLVGFGGLGAAIRGRRTIAAIA
jgi:hypothetical protein